MPVRQYKTNRPPQQGQLVDRLAQEWESPDPTATEPVVLEERNPKGEVVHVYVVWSDWAQMSRENRGEVIMDAAERIKPIPDVLKITIALGLTPEEADRFGIKWR
jgi:hypothetical protein